MQTSHTDQFDNIIEQLVNLNIEKAKVIEELEALNIEEDALLDKLKVVPVSPYLTGISRIPILSSVHHPILFCLLNDCLLVHDFRIYLYYEEKFTSPAYQ